MNTYNENLRSAVIASLQNQEVDQKNLKAKLNAAMFTLYHSEGNIITVSEKLDDAQNDLNYKTLVKAQAVANSNISNNELNSAKQANTYLKQSVNDTAVSAANIQIAANAVIRLASDMGGIFSIINAADFDTDIYVQAKEARELINDTAYAAEVTSQLAMEASMLTSEVSSDTVLSESTTSNNQMKSLLKVVSDEFANASQLVAQDNTALAAATAKEKVAEGNFKYLNVDYRAAVAAYSSMNEELNLALSVSTQNSDTSFTISFNKILNPFYDTNPVQNYYAFVVKESKSSVFSISNAENILISGSQKFTQITVPEKNTPKKSNFGNAATGIEIALRDNNIKANINFLNVDNNGTQLYDTDGDSIELGVNYVVFVMGVYTDEYKRKINNFSDYLSAPSLSFCLTQTLTAADSPSITVSLNNDNGKPTVENEYKVAFKLAEANPANTEYRCLLLPVTTNTSLEMLTESSAKLFMSATSLETISLEFDGKIGDLQSQVHQLEMDLQQAISEKNSKSEKDVSQKLDALNTRINNLNNQKEAKIKNLQTVSPDKIGFYFNTTLAEQVPAGSYIAATADGQSSNNTWAAYIKPGTTDNFGNMLMDNTKYIPVILSVYPDAEGDAERYTSTMSDPDNTSSFLYKEFANN